MALSLALAALPCAVAAQTYRCTDADGRRYYGETIPPQCAGRPVERLNAQGMVTRGAEPQEEGPRLAAPPRVRVIIPPPSVRDWQRDEREARERAERDRLELERLDRRPDGSRPHPPAQAYPDRVPAQRWPEHDWERDRARDRAHWDRIERHEEARRPPPSPGLRTPERPTGAGPRLGYEEEPPRFGGPR